MSSGKKYVQSQRFSDVVAANFERDVMILYTGLILMQKKPGPKPKNNVIS